MYTKQTWASGDTITAAKLNHIEDGIENASPWDAVIRLTHTADSGADIPANLTPSIVSGTFAELTAKISNTECPTILVQYVHPWFANYSSLMASITYASDMVISVVIAGLKPSSNIVEPWGLLYWGYDNDLTWED